MPPRDSKVIPLHRGIRLAAARPREEDRSPPPPARIDCAEWLQREPYRRRSTLDRMADALGSPRFVIFYAGTWFGCLLTAIMAYVWAVLS